jgi:hypothetical protein
MSPSTVLTAFQILVAETFFGMVESRGFLLAGGAALIAQGLSERPTQDLDFFTSPAAGEVRVAWEGLFAEANRLGWSHRLMRDHETFCRLVLVDATGGQVLVDLAVDSAPGQPSTITLMGPTFAPEELAGRKVIALFDRAEARDFVDVYVLARRYDQGSLLSWAAEIDPGFLVPVFVQMLARLNRFADDEMPIDLAEVNEVRVFFNSWATGLSADK